LEKWKVWRIGRWKGELVYRRDYAGIGDRPLQVARGFAAYDARRGAARSMPRVRGGGLGCRIIGARWEKLGNAEVALGRGRQQVVLCILRTKHEPWGAGDEGKNARNLCANRNRGYWMIGLKETNNENKDAG
jgi:hypothetical protein